MQTPSGTSIFHALQGTPVMMLRLFSFHSFPTWLFSIHTSAFSAVSLHSTFAFCTKIAGCGFTL